VDNTLRRPTVSVIMANYNHARFLPIALQAILSQTWRPLEVLVFDDGSTDNSIEVIEQFAERDSIIRLIRNERNRGVAYSCNRGVAIASGEYLLFSAADDYIMPSFLERSLWLLGQYPQAGLSCCDSAALDENSGVMREYKANITEQPRYFLPGEVVELAKTKRFTVGSQANAVLLKRSALGELEEEGAYFLSDLKSGCDFFPLNVIAFRYGICYVPETLAVFRLTPGSYSTSNKKNGQEICQRMLELIYLDKYKDVRPMFRDSELFYRFEHNLILVVLANVRFRSILTLGVIGKALSLSIKRIVWEALPNSLRELCLTLRGRNRIALKPKGVN
jgi:glycosyltransferase involved in cell wall biosynthesis